MTFCPGDLYGTTVLGTSALYRVLESKGGVVRVEVVRAPGLQPGQRFGFTRAALASMRRIDGEQSSVEDLFERWTAVA